MIISDDQSFGDFGFMGHSLIQTPNIDELAERSVRFVNGYVPYSVCRPSLATLLTGLYPHQNGIYFNRPYFDLPHTLENRHRANHLIRQVPTLPRILSTNGYKTLQTGKHWEGNYVNAGFDEGMSLAKPHFIEQEPAFAALGMKSGHSNGDAGLLIGRRTLKPINEFIDQTTKEKKPFFVWYAPFLPHTPYNAPKKYSAKYQDNAQVPEYLIPYYSNITWFDETVGLLLTTLEKRNLLQNTIVVFIVDNGYVVNPQQKMGPLRSKNTPFEQGLRTPVLIRWDGHFKPRSLKGLVSSVDIMPTLLEAVGISSIKMNFPGMNLLSVLNGQTDLPDRPVFGEIYRGYAVKLDHPEEEVLSRWIRWGQYKFVLPESPNEGKMLFDLFNDPDELNNLAGNPAFQKQEMKLENRINQWWNPTKRKN